MLPKRMGVGVVEVSDDSIKSYDDMLRQSLSRMFCERCLTSDQIKEFVRAPVRRMDKNSELSSILEQEPVIRGRFPSGEFKELSLLWMSVLAGYADSAELLVLSGADVNEPFGRHETQLMIDEKWTILHAMMLHTEYTRKNWLFLRLLLDHGADLQARDSYGHTSLNLAVLTGGGEDPVSLISLLLTKADQNVVNVADNNGQTPLLAAFYSSGVADKLLLVPYMLIHHHGADLQVKDHAGRNLLQLLANRWSRENQGNLESIARTLIKEGVSLEHRDTLWKRQPIHSAVESGNDDLVKLYLDHGANVNARAGMGEFPLSLAAVHTKPGVTKTLLERGADIHLRENSGRTALHVACTRFLRREEIISLLLSAGADPLTEDNRGNTPFALIEPRFRNIEHLGMQLLLKALAQKKACLQPSTELKDETIIQEYPQLWDYYRDCQAHISRMQHTRLVGSCTFFELLAKNSSQIAALMRNPAFEANFKLYDLSRFSMYAKDVIRAFERAQDLHRAMLKQEAVINEAVNNILPYVVVRKVVSYILLCR